MRNEQCPSLSISAASNHVTEAIGEALGRVAKAGDFVGLIGDLGAGKTSFSRGFARGVGISERAVSSPTFALVNSYEGGRIPLLHADLYRLCDAEELYDLGFQDFLDGQAALVVEWIDQVPEVAPEGWLEVRIEKRKRSRRFHFFAHGPRAQEMLEQAGLGKELRG